ncbi:MAG: DUF2779 domain-containing protein [Pyrinomonadaceae bacterium]
MLTKSKYVQFLRCPNEYWLKESEPELFKRERTVHDRHLREQGYEVQKLVRKMSVFQLDPAFYTVEFEQRFEAAGMLSEADVSVTDQQTGDIALYEIKSAASVKNDHYIDLAFQKAVAEAMGLTVSKTYVITVNNRYLPNGRDLDADMLFNVTDVSEEVAALSADTLQNIARAFEFLETVPVPALTDFCKSKVECAFIQKHFPDIPAYNVFQVSRLGDKKLNALLGDGIVDIRHIPDDFKLSEIQRIQVDAARTGVPYIERDLIASELSSLEYPLNFLDYETFSYALPIFADVAPYQKMVFQYSLHTIDVPGAKPRHSGHIAKNDGSHPAGEVAGRLHNAMKGGIGTVIVWNQKFEKSCNRDLGRMFPEFADFYDEVNEHIFDLATIFEKQWYVHHEFRGKTSIKKILPVLVPERSYKDMNIADGKSAPVRWYHMATGRLDAEESQTVYNDLWEYCHLDTLAMVEIYNRLMVL